ncbi:MAG: hypothetical protein IKO07_03340 [Clostridia bacterium]|nr:hypothetical protein [Clostridia bacterium]
MRDWKKAFGQPDDAFNMRVQQTLLAIEEKEEEPVKKKMTFSLTFACVLFVTILAVSALAASNLLGGRPDGTVPPLSPGATGLPAATDPPAAGDAWFGGTIADPTFLGIAPGTSTDEALGVLEEEKGYANADAMLALYGDETTVTRYQWPEAVWAGEPCAVRAYFAEGRTLGLSLVFERGTGDEALPELIRALHARLTEVYGESTPLAIPEEWPSMALRDLSLAEWRYLDGPRVFLVYQVRRDGTVQVEARVGHAEPPSEAAELQPTLLPTPMPMEPAPYWTTAYGNYYHIDEHCSGMEGAQRVSFETAVNMGKQPCPICVVEYFRAQEMDAAATEQPAPQPTLLPMPPCWTTPEGVYWHLDEHCSGMEGAVSVSRDEAELAGKLPCPVCVEEYFRALEMDAALEAERAAGATLPPEPLPVQADDGADGDGVALMTDFNQPLRAGEARGWGIDLTDPNREDFNAGSEPLNSEVNGSWTNDILTVHNVVFLRTRSALFMEFEYSMNDMTIDPWSIRIQPYMEGEAGPLGLHDAMVHEVSGEDNTIHYLLSIVTDSPADFQDMANILGVFGAGLAEPDKPRILGSLGKNLDWGRQYGK